MSKNKIYISAALVALVFLGVFFRNGISELLEFGPGPANENPGRIATSSFSKEESAKPPEKQAESSPIQNTQNRTVSVPPYVGRDPEEVRPTPEEVKLFTEEQKERLYASIRTNGRSVKNDSAFFQGWIQLGALKKTIGDFEGAQDAWEYAGLIQPKNSLSVSNLGDLYWRYLRDYPKAEKNFKLSIERKPDDLQNYLGLADLYHYSYEAKRDLAPNVLLDGLKANAGDQTLLRHLAYIYELREEFSRALETWREVLAKSPEDEGVKDKIQKLKDKLGIAS